MRKIIISIILGGFVTLLYFAIRLALFEKPWENKNSDKTVVRTILSGLNNDIPCYTVVFFLAGDCPLCKNYRPYIEKFSDSLANLPNWKVYVFRPDSFDLTDPAGEKRYSYYFSNYDVSDPDNTLASAMGAMVTPEVFVLDSNYNEIYHGAINNRSYDTGKTRVAATEFYLDSVVSSIRNGKYLAPFSVKASGCYIEYQKEKVQ